MPCALLAWSSAGSDSGSLPPSPLDPHPTPHPPPHTGLLPWIDVQQVCAGSKSWQISNLLIIALDTASRRGMRSEGQLGLPTQHWQQDSLDGQQDRRCMWTRLHTCGIVCDASCDAEGAACSSSSSLYSGDSGSASSVGSISSPSPSSSGAGQGSSSAFAVPLSNCWYCVQAHVGSGLHGLVFGQSRSSNIVDEAS
jgi:hypothetical protein